MVAVAGVVLVVAGGCSAPDDAPGGQATSGQPAGPTAATSSRAVPDGPVTAAESGLDPDDGYVLTAVGDGVVVLDSPDGEQVEELANPRDTGAPLTFLLAEDPDDGEAGWYRVYVPVRPNGTTGWVSAAEVSVARVPFRLEMSVSENELTVFNGDEVVRTMSAASGTGDTPTPLGRFFLTELLEPTNTGYGPYAYGLSGFSEVLDSFGGGPGQIGLHGTDDPDSVGRSVSAGCIRLSDVDITFLAELLPLGTPVDIV